MARQKSTLPENQTISESDLKAIVDAEIEWSMGYVGGELSSEREEAMDYYLGNPYKNEVEGRSQVMTREVMDTIEWILPDLMRIFTTTDRAVQFEAIGEEDEDAADQESDTVNHVFYKKNKGWMVLYSWFKDALLQKNGIVKCYWDDSEKEVREEYEGLTSDELVLLMQDEELEVIEQEEIFNPLTGEAVYNVVFMRTTPEGYPVVLPVPPEEFLISRDANSCYTDSARFVGHRVRRTASELIQMGYDEDIVNKIPADEGYTYNDERVTRRHLEDESPDTEVSTLDQSMRTFWVTECYLKVDFDGDGVAELRKVTRAGDTLLDNEEIDRIPFHSITPIILTHKFFGFSIADITKDLQLQKSTVLRNVFDNFYQANNVQKVANQNVNLSDLLTNRPGGIIRTEGRGPVSNDIMPIVNSSIGGDGYTLLAYLDKIRKDRTGVDENVQGISPDVLAHANNGALAASADAAKQRITLIARIFAETGVKDLFLHIHELLQKHQTKELAIKLRGKWENVNPSEWKKRENMTINVGLGTGSRDQQMMGIASILEAQEKLIQGGAMGKLLTEGRVFNALEKLSEANGYKSGDTFFLNPESEEAKKIAQQMQQQKKPTQNPLAEAEMVKAKAKTQSDQMAAQVKMQLETMKAQQEKQLDIIKMQMELSKAEADRTSKENIEAAKLEIKAMIEGLKVDIGAPGIGGGL